MASFGTEFPIGTSSILVGIRFFSGKFSVFMPLFPVGTGKGLTMVSATQVDCS